MEVVKKKFPSIACDGGDADPEHSGYGWGGLNFIFSTLILYFLFLAAAFCSYGGSESQTRTIFAKSEE